MKPCPACAESIQDEALVCRFCGADLSLAFRKALLERSDVSRQFIREWKAKGATAQQTAQALCLFALPARRIVAEMNAEDFPYKKGQRWSTPYVELVAKTANARELGIETMLGQASARGGGAAPSSSTNRCPNCGSSNVTVQRQVGCAVVIFIFISMGLGLLMIPFLPKHGHCSSCSLEWKV